MSDLNAHFLQLEAVFVQLMKAIADTLSPAQIADIRHFLDYGEYGLAMETTVYTYFEDKVAMPTEVSTLLEKLACLMEKERPEMMSVLRSMTRSS